MASKVFHVREPRGSHKHATARRRTCTNALTQKTKLLAQPSRASRMQLDDQIRRVAARLKVSARRLARGAERVRGAQAQRVSDVGERRGRGARPVRVVVGPRFIPAAVCGHARGVCLHPMRRAADCTGPRQPVRCHRSNLSGGLLRAFVFGAVEQGGWAEHARLRSR
jgi:hypothetical protein